MRLSYTSITTPLPRFISSNNKLESQLSLLSVPNPIFIIDAVRSLYQTSSIFSLIDAVMSTTSPCKSTLALAALSKILQPAKSSKEYLYLIYKKDLSQIMQLLDSINSVEEFNEFVVSYLGLSVFPFTFFLNNPFALLDWVIANDPSYSNLLTYLKDKNLFAFFIELVRVKGRVDVRQHSAQRHLLARNVRTYFYDYVIGSDPKLSLEDKDYEL